MSAIAHLVDSVHPNVLRLSLVRTAFDRAVVSLLLRLPLCIQSLARSIIPGYFLPQKVILKSLKRDWDDEFENEKTMYKRLESLQGRVIPTLYGEAQYERSPALVLSYVDGILPFKQDPDAPLDADEFESRVESALWEFTTFGVAYGDTKLDNFLIVRDGVVLVDLEAVSEVEPNLYELAVTSHLDHLMMQYKSYLANRYDDY